MNLENQNPQPNVEELKKRFLEGFGSGMVFTEKALRNAVDFGWISEPEAVGALNDEAYKNREKFLSAVDTGGLVTPATLSRGIEAGLITPREAELNIQHNISKLSPPQTRESAELGFLRPEEAGLALRNAVDAAAEANVVTPENIAIATGAGAIRSGLGLVGGDIATKPVGGIKGLAAPFLAGASFAIGGKAGESIYDTLLRKSGYEDVVRESVEKAPQWESIGAELPTAAASYFTGSALLSGVKGLSALGAAAKIGKQSAKASAFAVGMDIGGRVAERALGGEAAPLTINSFLHSAAVGLLWQTHGARSMTMKDVERWHRSMSADPEATGRTFDAATAKTSPVELDPVKNAQLKYLGDVLNGTIPLERLNYELKRSVETDGYSTIIGGVEVRRNNDGTADARIKGKKFRIESLGEAELEQRIASEFPEKTSDEVAELVRRGQGLKSRDGNTLLIKKSVSDKDPILTHELLHLARDQKIISDAQWNLLKSRYAPEAGVDYETTKRRYKEAGVDLPNPDDIAHEVIAKKFEDWQRYGNAPKDPLLVRASNFVLGMKSVSRVLGRKPTYDKPIENKTGEEVVKDILAGRYDSEPIPVEALPDSVPRLSTSPVEPPQKTVKAYKLFRVKKSEPGKLYPLFIGKNKPVETGTWIPAEHIPTPGFAARPGWHVGVKPMAAHLMRKDGSMSPDRVWAEVEIPADVDWQQVANQSPSKDIRDAVPEGGHYRFARPSNQGGEWMIAGSMKVNKVLTPEDVSAILAKENYERSTTREDGGFGDFTDYRVVPGGDSAGRDFVGAITEATRGHPFAAAVEIKPASEYAKPGYKLIVSKTGDSGVAVTPDLDVVSVFKKYRSSDNIHLLLNAAVKRGGITLDAYDVSGVLPNLYLKHDFVPAARIKFNRDYAPEGWPYDKAGEPDIVFMVHDPNGVTGLPRAKDYNQIREQVAVAKDYEEAVNIRKKFVELATADKSRFAIGESDWADLHWWKTPAVKAGVGKANAGDKAVSRPRIEQSVARKLGVKEGWVPLRHWSATRREAIDPKFQGTGIGGEETARRKAYPDLYPNRMYFGLRGYKREPGLGKALHSVQVKVNRLYDIDADKLDLLEKAESVVYESGKYAKYDKQASASIFENLIKENGFGGYYSPSREIAALFKPVSEGRNARFAIERILSGEEKVPKFETLKDAAKFIKQFAKERKVIPGGVNIGSVKGREEAVKSIVQHTLDELAAWRKLGGYRSFYKEDITEKANPMLREYFRKKHGRELTPEEVAAFHLFSALGSAQTNPSSDSQLGIKVLEGYITTGRATGLSEKPAQVWKVPPGGEGKQPQKKVFIDSKTGEDTFEPKGNQPKLKGVNSRISRTYNVYSLGRFNQILDHFGGDIGKTIEWLGSKHGWENIKSVVGEGFAKKLKQHEYLDKDGESFGVFALGNNPKLGSYILNRWQNLDTITKDMWVARTMSRFFREPNTGKPWQTTEEGLYKRRILDDAWGQVAQQLGVKPAEVQEMMWDAEKRFYAILGHDQGAAYVSQGVAAELGKVTAGETPRLALERKPEKFYLGKQFQEVADNSIPEKPPVPVIDLSGKFPVKSAREALYKTIFENAEPFKAQGFTVNLNYPDIKLGRQLGMRDDSVQSRIHHALTTYNSQSGKREFSASKVLSAPLVENTIRNSDFVLKMERDPHDLAIRESTTTYGRGFVKLYDINGEPRWHVVETDGAGNFITQYSIVPGKTGRRVLLGRVEKAGRRMPELKLPQGGSSAEVDLSTSPLIPSGNIRRPESDNITVEESVKPVVSELQKSGVPVVSDGENGAVISTGNATIVTPGSRFALTAHHGTPHKVDKFKTERIGTGEGAQVYGWGLYFAQNPEVARRYREQLGATTEKSVELWKKILSRVRELYPNQDARGTAQDILGTVDSQRSEAFNKLTPADRALFSEYEKSKAGYEYTVEIKAEPEELLNWDGKQTPETLNKLASLRDVLNESSRATLFDEAGNPEPDASGELWYNALSSSLKTPAKNLPPWVMESVMFRGETMVGNDKKASETLLKLGIKGVRYMDERSRQAPNADYVTKRIKTVEAEIAKWNDPDTSRFHSEKAVRNMRANLQDELNRLRKTLSEALNAPPPTNNYVIFDGADISITHENGERVNLGAPRLSIGEPERRVLKTRIQKMIDEVAGVAASNRKKTDTAMALKKAEAAGKAGKLAGILFGKEQAKAEASETITNLRQRMAEMITNRDAMRLFYQGQEAAGKVAAKEVKRNLSIADRWMEAEVTDARSNLLKLVDSALPPADRGDFTRRILSATRRQPITAVRDMEAMIERIKDVTNMIQSRVEKNHRADLISEIKTAMDRVAYSPSVDIKLKRVVAKILDNLGVENFSPAKRKQLELAKARIEAAKASGLPHGVPDEIVDLVSKLGRTKITELPTSAIEAIHEKLVLLEQIGRDVVKDRKQVWEEEKAILLGKLKDEVTTPYWERRPVKRGVGEEHSFRQKITNLRLRIQNLSDRIDIAVSPVDVVADMMGEGKGRYDGWLIKNVRNPLDLDTNIKFNLQNELVREARELQKKHGLKSDSAERIGVYAISKMDGGKERLMEERGLSSDEIDRAVSEITPVELEVYRAMRRAMEKTFPQVQELMHELYNVEVNPVENYFPFQRDYATYRRGLTERRNELSAEDGELLSKHPEVGSWLEGLQQDFTGNRTSRGRQGSTISRKKNAKTSIKIDAFDIFEKHINDVSHLIASQRDMKRIGEMIRSEQFAEKYGDFGQKIWLDWLDTYARQGGTGGGLSRWPLLDALRKNSSLATISWRIVSNFKHSSNSAFALQRAGAEHFYLGLKEAMTPRGEEFLKKNFAETFERGGGEPALTELVNDGAVSKFGKAGFYIERKIDKYNAQACTLGVYMRLLESKGIDALDYDKVPIDRDAQAMAMLLSRRAVASPMPKDVPLGLSRGMLTGGNVSLGRSFMQFQNIMLDQWSNVRHDLWRAGIRQKNPRLAAEQAAAFLAAIATEVGVVHAIKGGIAKATGVERKEETFVKEVAFDILKRVPLMGNQIANLRYPNSGISQTGVPIMDTLLTGKKSLGKVVLGDAQRRDYFDTATTAAAVLGIPASGQALEVIEKATRPEK